MNFKPTVVSWNITQACNLRCPHCYLAAGRPALRGLLTQESLKLIDQLRDLGTELLILTGGEPLLRKDLCALAQYASDRGLMVVLGTNGTLIAEKTAQKLKASGVRGVGISLDSLDAEKHDAFRGLRGAWEKAIRAIEICVAQGLEVAVQTSVLPMNYDEIPQLIEFAYEKGARAFNAYFLVCTGRGERLTDITPHQYEALLSYLINAQARYLNGKRSFLVRAKCAPHIKRLAYTQLSSSQVDKFASGQVGAVGLLVGAGCPVGTGYLRIGPEGDVTPCPYLPFVLGNVRQTPLRQIWESSDILHKLRGLELRGRCGVCEFKELCVGCRARAFALTGDLFGEDPWCAYQPKENNQLENLSTAVWEAEALARIERIPSFVRERVKQGVEAYAKARGIEKITPELLTELRTAFFRSKTAKDVRTKGEDRHV